MARPEEPSGSTEDSDLENPEFLYEVDEENGSGEDAQEGVFGADPSPDAGAAQAAAAQDDLDLGDVDELEPEFGTVEADLSAPSELELISDVEAREREQADADPTDAWDPYDDGLAPSPPSLGRAPIPILSGAGFAKEEPAAEGVADEVGAEAPAGRRERKSLRGFSSMLAAVVGAILIGGGLRTLKLYAIDYEPGPPTVRTTGWIATDVEAMHLRDSKGRRVLIVRGNLSSDGTTRTPKVLATLLDADGEAVGSAVPGLMTRLEGAALAPEAVARRLDTPSTSRSRGRARGFTILIPDPPQEARRYRVELML